MSEYAERDLRVLEEGGYFSRHMEALTEENLREKSAIAAELAWRDRQISQLRDEMAELRERAEKAELERNEESIRVSQLNAELNEKHDRLARYEAPGPALIQEAHECHCAGGGCDDGDCDCGAYEMNRAYREQHARCVAVVDQVLLQHSILSSHDALIGCEALRKALAALTGAPQNGKK